MNKIKEPRQNQLQSAFPSKTLGLFLHRTLSLGNKLRPQPGTRSGHLDKARTHGPPGQ